MRLNATRSAPVFLLATLVGCNCGTTPLLSTNGVLTLQAALQFKNVCIGDSVTKQFNLNNDGRGPLTIESIDISPPTFTITPAFTGPQEIAPNGSLTISVVFAPHSGGSTDAVMTVTSDALTNGTQSTTIIGSTFAGDGGFDIVCECDRSLSPPVCGLTGSDAGVDDPCAFLSYTNVPDGTELSRTVTLSNGGCKTLAIDTQLYDSANNSMSDTSTALFSAPTSQIVLHGGQSQDVVVGFNPPAGTQMLTPEVRMKFDSCIADGGACDPTVEIGLLANSVLPELVVSPQTMSFFSTAMGQTGTQSFTVSNAGNSPLAITSIAVKNDALPDGGPGTSDFGLQLMGGESAFTLAATGDPSGNDVRTETVTWAPTMATTEHAVIMIQATGASAQIDVYGGISPVMTVTWLDSNMSPQTPPIDFGQTATGATGLTRTVVITNSGSATLNVMTAEVHDASNTNPSMSFALSGFTAGSLAPNQTSRFTITFNDAVTVNNDAGKLDITSNDAVDVLNGSGIRTMDLLSTNVADFPPVAEICAVSSMSVATCAPLTLDGSCTMPVSGQTGDTISYQWNITKKPSGSTVSFGTPTGVSTQVQSANCAGVDLPGEYDFTLTASDQYPGNKDTSAPTKITAQ